MVRQAKRDNRPRIDNEGLDERRGLSVAETMVGLVGVLSLEAIPGLDSRPIAQRRLLRLWQGGLLERAIVPHASAAVPSSPTA